MVNNPKILSWTSNSSVTLMNITNKFKQFPFTFSQFEESVLHFRQRTYSCSCSRYFVPESAHETADSEFTKLKVWMKWLNLVLTFIMDQCCKSYSPVILFVVVLISFLANKRHSKYQYREVERQSVATTVTDLL